MADTEDSRTWLVPKMMSVSAVLSPKVFTNVVIDNVCRGPVTVKKLVPLLRTTNEWLKVEPSKNDAPRSETGDIQDVHPVMRHAAQRQGRQDRNPFSRGNKGEGCERLLVLMHRFHLGAR